MNARTTEMDNSNNGNINEKVNEKKRKLTALGESMASDSITDAAAHLHSLLQSKEKDLKEREADFTRRVNLFESQNPTLGGDSDIIQLNVGGQTNIAVHRRTLTQFQDSMLAAKFSGRWDDSMEHDRDGNIFIDQDPDNFFILINYLRLRMNNRSRQVPDKHMPKATYSFCSMLEYYDLMPGVYPQTWVGEKDTFTCEEVSYGTVVLSTIKEGEKSETLASSSVLHCFGQFASAGVSEFTVEFEKGTDGAVGWLFAEDNGRKSVLSRTLTEVAHNSIFLSVPERKIFGPTSILKENMSFNYKESATKVVCRHDGHQEYSIEVAGVSPTEGGVATTLQKSKQSSYDSPYARVFPMISFSGKVTVSGLKYAIDQL